MKRILSVLLLLCLACSAACAADQPELTGYNAKTGYTYVTFGRYPQTAEGGVEPILWRVLTADREKVYLCSEYVLFARELHHSLTEYKTTGKDFGNTDLSHYLNEEFAAEAFTAAELDVLLEKATYGKIFLLDSADVNSKELGMGKTNGKTSPGMRAWGTPYAMANGLFAYQKKNGGHSPYWVVNQSTSDKRHGRCTKVNGTLGHIECGRDNEGVRPAVQLTAGAFVITGGSGTMEDPYTVEAPAEESPEE